MSKKISNLSYNSFNIADEFNERLPKYNNNLIAHFPLDGTLTNCIPEAEIYVEDNMIKTKGIIKDIIKLNSNVIVSNNAMNFNGDIDCYLDLNTEILNGATDYEIEIKFKETSRQNPLGCILHSGRLEQDKNENELSLVIQRYDNSLILDCWNKELGSSQSNHVNNKTYYISQIGDMTVNESYIVKISRTKNVVTSIINDSFKSKQVVMGKLKVDRLIIGQENDQPCTSNSFDRNQSFIGEIEYIKFKRFSNIGTNTILPEISEFGLCGVKTSVNINTSDEIDIYNNIGVSTELEDSNSKLMDYKIRRVTMTLPDQTSIDMIKANNGGLGIRTKDKLSYIANTKYCSYIFFKPISHKDLVISGVATNYDKIYEGKVTKLSNGWFMYYQYRKGNHIIDFKDNVFFNFYSKTVEIGEDVVIEVSPIITIEGLETPGALDIKPLTTINKNNIHPDYDRLINPIIDNFSVGFEWTPLAHITDYDISYICSLGSWSEDETKDWIEIYREKELGIDTLNVAIGSKNTNTELKLCKYENFDLSISNKLYVGISYNLLEKKVIVIVYDKTLRKYLIRVEESSEKFIINKFENWLLNYLTGDIINNISIYNKSLAINEFEENFIDKLSINEKGSIKVNSITETIPSLDKNNIYYLPLNTDTKSICGRLNKSNKYQEPSFLESSALTGDVKADLIIDLTRHESLSCSKITSLPWEADLHKDAYNLNKWSNGYISTVSDANIGYHAKWVKERSINRLFGKFINKNKQYNNKNRLLNLSRTIGSTEFNLWNNCSIGDKITVSFKAKSDTNGSTIEFGFNRFQKSDDIKEFDEHFTNVSLTTNWKEYSYSFTIDPDWNLLKEATLNFYGNTGSIESTSWFTDVILIKKGPELTSEVTYNLKEGQGIEFNLNKDIGLKWNEPWQICYWKKPLSTGKTYNYNIDSLGAENQSNLGYAHFGSDGPTTLRHSFRGINNQSSNYEPNSYFNNWIFVSVKYDGAKITCEEYGETLSFKSSFDYVIPNDKYYLINEDKRDLLLGGYVNGKFISNATQYKDLIILKNQCMTDEETLSMYRTKMKYKEDKLIANFNLEESLYIKRMLYEDVYLITQNGVILNTETDLKLKAEGDIYFEEDIKINKVIETEDSEILNTENEYDLEEE